MVMEASSTMDLQGASERVPQPVPGPSNPLQHDPEPSSSHTPAQNHPEQPQSPTINDEPDPNPPQQDQQSSPSVVTVKILANPNKTKDVVITYERKPPPEPYLPQEEQNIKKPHQKVLERGRQNST